MLGNYENPTDLFINLRNGNVNPRKAFKNKNEFKSELGRIKKGNPKSKSKDQASVIHNIQIFLI